MTERTVYAVPRKFIIAWFVTLACMIALTGAAIQFYTDYYRENPPQTELQKRQFALMEKRRIELGCR